MKAGLGFLSSLVLNREKALKYRSSVVYGNECAHLDISSRIALQEKGPFVLLGSLSTAARATPVLRYNPFNSCILHQKKLFDVLKSEKLLSHRAHKYLTRRLLLKDFVKVFLKASLSEEEKRALFQEVRLATIEYPSIFRLVRLVFCLKNNQKTKVYYFLKGVFRSYQQLKKLLAS